MQDVTEDAAAPPIVAPLPVLVPDGADASVRELAFAAQQYAQAQNPPSSCPARPLRLTVCGSAAHQRRKLLLRTPSCAQILSRE
jgi:hypothetical protein